MKLGGLLLICVVFSISCVNSIAVSDNEQNRELKMQPTPEKMKPPIPVEISSLSSSQLCEKLADIKIIPTRDPTIADPIYESLIAKGDDSILCLVEKISDKTPTPDPRYSVPTWQHYAVGDTAVFILVDIIGKDDDEREKLLIKMMPPKSQKEWDTNGIYAYFNYVSESNNRKELQRWWRNWLKENNR